MTNFVKKALADILSNRFLNLITIITISLSILFVSLFLLFFENAGRVIESWNQGGRVMIYLNKDFSLDNLPKLKEEINALGDIHEIVYISKTRALEKLKKDMASQSAFLKSLEENPLPNALEIRMKSYNSVDEVQSLPGQ